MPNQHSPNRGGFGNHRGRGGKGYRGGDRGRGRGRGNFRGRGRGQGGPSHNAIPPPEDVDFIGDFENFNIFASQFSQPARQLARRARGRFVIRQDQVNPRPRGRFSRGLGFTTLPMTSQEKTAWEASRPLLQPVKFVPAVTHKMLFQEIDEILQLPKQSSEEKEDRFPSANEVARVFGIVEEDKSPIRDGSPEEIRELQETLDFSVVTTCLEAGVVVKIEDGDNDLEPESLPQQAERFTKPRYEHLVSSAIPDDDEIIYDAPKARLSRAATPVAPPSKEPSSVATEPQITMESLTFKFEKSATIVPSERPFTSNRTPKKTKTSRKGKEPIRFGSFGAQLEEQRLHDMIGSSHAKKEKRYGSDIEWGSEGGKSDEEGLGDDMLDSDIDQGHYRGFLNSIRSINGSNHVTIDDLNDVEQLRKEDEEDEPASEEEDEDEDTDSSEAESEGDDVDPSGSSFQARLARIRKQSSDTKSPFAPADGLYDSDDFEGSDVMDKIEAFLAGDDDALDSDDDDIDFNQTKHSKYIPPHLKAQWERDKAKKAETKRARRIARIQQNQLKPKERKKLRKKSEFELLQAGLLASASDSRLDMVDVELLLREYVADIGNDGPLKLPPLDKETRARIHQLAHAFHLRSKSTGYGEGRFITLFKTSKTGMPAKEWQVTKLLRRNGVQGKRIMRHKEGDEVGKSAPKIGEGNVGFKLLQQMGWQEGEVIGVSGGLEAPIAAIMKLSKRGLGANTNA